VTRFRAPVGYYSVADIAAQRGTDHAAAWRWLSRNGGKHFRRFGGFRIISKEKYRQLEAPDASWGILAQASDGVTFDIRGWVTRGT
jgi:hypothetical protein